MSGHNKKAASAESFITAAQLFHEKNQLIKGIKPQGKPVCPTKAGPEPNNRNRPKGRGIEPKSRRKRRD
tara:strand:+ start:3757 stop:3963 length:207 start_codon:yes stop_codon:yes gene_type:complete